MAAARGRGSDAGPGRFPNGTLVLSIYARLWNLPADIVHGQAYDFDTGSPRAEALGDELLRAARAGTLIARRRQVRFIVVPLDT